MYDYASSTHPSVSTASRVVLKKLLSDTSAGPLAHDQSASRLYYVDQDPTNPYIGYLTLNTTYNSRLLVTINYKIFGFTFDARHNQRYDHAYSRTYSHSLTHSFAYYLGGYTGLYLWSTVPTMGTYTTWMLMRQPQLLSPCEPLSARLISVIPWASRCIHTPISSIGSTRPPPVAPRRYVPVIWMALDIVKYYSIERHKTHR